MNSFTAYVVMYRFITWWLLDYNRRMGVLATPKALAHPLHPIRSRSRNKRRNCGLDDVLPLDDIGSGPYTSFIIYILYIIAAIEVNKKSKRHTYQNLAWPCWCVGWYDAVNISCFVWNIHHDFHNDRWVKYWEFYGNSFLFGLHVEAFCN